MTKKSSKGTALVTGGAIRIGKSICEYLAKEGYRLAIHYRNSKAKAESLKAQIIKNGSEADIFKCDLNKPFQTEKLIFQVKRKFSDLNLLINNASIFKPSDLKSFKLDSFDEHINTNLKAPMILTRDFARKCKKGHIINILDTHITSNTSNYVTYLLSKKSLAYLTKISALGLAPYIRVNAIAPGLILAPVKKTNRHLNRLAKKIPLQKTGSPQNIVQSVEFLIKNVYLNGQILFNDGGEHLI